MIRPILFALLGLLLFVAGVGMVYPPAALMVCGAAIVATSMLLEVRE